MRGVFRLWCLGLALVAVAGCDSTFLATAPDPVAQLFPSGTGKSPTVDWSNGCVPGETRCLGGVYEQQCVIGPGGVPGPSSGKLCTSNELCVVDHCQSVQSCDWPCPPDFQCGGDGRCVAKVPTQVQVNLLTSKIHGRIIANGESLGAQNGPCTPARALDVELIGTRAGGHIHLTAGCQGDYTFDARVLRDLYQVRISNLALSQQIDATGPEATVELDLAAARSVWSDTDKSGAGNSGADAIVSVRLTWNGAPLPKPPACVSGSAAHLRLRDPGSGDEVRLEFPCSNPTATLAGHVRAGTWELTLFFDEALAYRFGGPQWKGGVPLDNLWISGPGLYDVKLETRPVDVTVRVDGVPPPDGALCPLQAKPMNVQPSPDEPDRAVPLNRVCGRPEMTFEGFAPVGTQLLRMDDPGPSEPAGSLPLMGGAELLHMKLP